MSKRTQCKNYSKENKKPIYKRAWLGALAIVIVAGATGCSDVDNSKEVNSGNVEAVQEVSQDNSENTIAENKLEDKVEDNIPTEHKSALEEAQYYSDNMGMSKARIYDKLTSELGFTAEATQYAVDNVKADWKEIALKKAKIYQKTMPMSKATMYKQLTDEHTENFTAEEAQYAVDNAGINWKKNALEWAKYYQIHMSMSPGEIYDQLTADDFDGGFTAEEAQYAIDNLN